MAGVVLEIDFNTAGAGQAFAALRLATSDLRPMLEDVGAEVESSTLERFETNIAPDGTAWPQSYRAQLEGTPTLVDEGFLRDSLNYQVDGDAVVIAAGGPAAPYAAVHQVGATITAKGEALRFQLADGGFITAKSVRIPARPYLGVSEADRSAILDIIFDHLGRAAVTEYQAGR